MYDISASVSASEAHAHPCAISPILSFTYLIGVLLAAVPSFSLSACQRLMPRFRVTGLEAVWNTLAAASAIQAKIVRFVLPETTCPGMSLPTVARNAALPFLVNPSSRGRPGTLHPKKQYEAQVNPACTPGATRRRAEVWAFRLSSRLARRLLFIFYFLCGALGSDGSLRRSSLET